MVDKSCDAFRDQSRSPNIFHMLGIVSYYCALTIRDIRLQKMSWPWNPAQRSLKVIENVTIHREPMTSYWRSIATMALSRVVSEIFNVEKNIATLKPQSRTNQGHWKWYYSIDWVWFPSYYDISNFVPKNWDIRLQKCRDLESRVSSIKIIENVTIRQSACDFLWTFHSNHGPISYHFRDRLQFWLKIAKKFPPPCILRPRWRGSPCK